MVNTVNFILCTCYHNKNKEEEEEDKGFGGKTSVCF